MNKWRKTYEVCSLLRTSLGTQICLENKFSFKNVNPLNLELLNQAKNISCGFIEFPNSNLGLIGQGVLKI